MRTKKRKKRRGGQQEAQSPHEKEGERSGAQKGLSDRVKFVMSIADVNQDGYGVVCL